MNCSAFYWEKLRTNWFTTIFLGCVRELQAPLSKKCWSIFNYVTVYHIFTNLINYVLHKSVFTRNWILFCRCFFSFSIQQALEPSDRQSLVNLTRWFVTCINQPQFAKVLGKIRLCEKMVPVLSKTSPASSGPAHAPLANDTAASSTLANGMTASDMLANGTAASGKPIVVCIPCIGIVEIGEILLVLDGSCYSTLVSEIFFGFDSTHCILFCI